MHKFRILFPVLVCAVLCAGACSEGNDNNSDGPNDDPTTDFGKSRITYEQRKNCPVAANLKSAVWRRTIYFVSNDGDFISYDPAKDTWKTLARVEARQYYDHHSLFVWRDELYGYFNRDFRIYRPETDTWSPTDAIVPVGSTDGAPYSIKDRLFYSFPSSSYGNNGYVYLPDEKRWDKVDLGNFVDCFQAFCELGGSAYGINDDGEIYQFDPVAVTATKKVAIADRPVSRCAGVYKDKMLYRMYYHSSSYSNYYYAGIYDPETNDYVSLENNNVLDWIIGGGHWISVSGRIFVAPNNSKFYELKVVQ